MAREPQAAEVFFALGDPTRLSVVRKLAAGEPLSATALARGAKVTRQAVAKHLAVLEGVGLVRPERLGREVVYSLEVARLRRAEEFLEGISSGWDRAIERLRRVAEER